MTGIIVTRIATTAAKTIARGTEIATAGLSGLVVGSSLGGSVVLHGTAIVIRIE